MISVLFDPFQMIATSERLAYDDIKMEEFPQTTGNLTEAAQNLFELIQGKNFVGYPDDAIRLAITRAIAIEGSRGWRIGKDKQVHKIDIVEALAMAALACVRAQKKGRLRMGFVTGPGGGHVIEVEPVTLRPIDQPARTRIIRVINVSEKDVPAVRGPY